MIDRLRRAGLPASNSTLVAALAVVGLFMLHAEAEAGAGAVKGIGNAAGALGDIGKQLDINPGIVPNGPAVTPPAGAGGWVTPPGGQIGNLPGPPKGWTSAPGGQIGALPPRPLPPTSGAAPTPPPRPLPPIILGTPPGRQIPPLDPDLPPPAYSGLGPDNVPVRKITPQVSTGIGVLRPEPNPLNFPVPKVANPNAPVVLPGRPIASVPPGGVNLPPARPIGTIGAPPQALLKLYGEDEATKALNAIADRAARIANMKRAGKVALATVVVGGVGAAAYGGYYYGVECTAKELSDCPELFNRGVKVKISNQTGKQVTVAILNDDNSETSVESPTANGSEVELRVETGTKLNVYKDGVFFNTFAVTGEDWEIPLR